MNKGVGAAILAGGQSSRMGETKALMKMASGGPTLIETVAARLREAGLPAPLLVTNSPEEYAFLGLRCVPDDVQGAGAIGGILTALNHSGYTRVLVVACDMPMLSATLLRYMASTEGDYDALVPRWRDGTKARIEPLHAIYSINCAGTIRRHIEDGKLKASDLVRAVNTRFVDENEIRRFDPDMRSFVNVNTPQEWEAVRTFAGYL